ncbi:MAG TPA: ABC transporter permease [Pyrinomonadaceae bacterium]|nr:ABC transporter permease [Pyrinomonadaceae bacterium]
MSAIYWRELRDLLKSRRFGVAACIFLLGMALNGYVISGIYRELFKMHEEVEARSRERLREAAAHVELLAINFNEIFGENGQGQVLIVSAPPPRLLPLVTGADPGGLEAVEWNFPNEAEPADLGIGNGEMPVRPVLDWEFMVRILLSFVAIILSYDLIVGERERGTLALTLAYPVSRARVLSAKFAAVMTLMGWLLLAGSLLSTLIYTGRATGAFAPSEYARLGLFDLGALLYLALFVGVSLLVSSRARTSASSLIALLIFWIAVTIVIPQGGTAAVQGSVSTVSDVQVEQRVMQQIEGQINELVGEMDSFIRSDFNAARKDGFSSERNFARRVNQMIATIKATVAEQQESHNRQARVVRNILRLTPAGLFQLGSEHLLGVGDDRDRHFLRSVDEWADTYARFVQEQDMLDPDSPHVFYVQNYMSQRSVDPGAIPRFRFEELSLKESLKNSLLDWALLIIELAVALALSFASFARAPVSEAA